MIWPMVIGFLLFSLGAGFGWTVGYGLGLSSCSKDLDAQLSEAVMSGVKIGRCAASYRDQQSERLGLLQEQLSTNGNGESNGRETKAGA